MASLRITEIFYSLQGESVTVGLPTVFVRLTGCPLRCSYCDTAYAFSGGRKLDLDAVMAEVRQYGTPYVTVTGGEPLAQPLCRELMRRLADQGFRVSLETSGALDLAGIDPRVMIVMDLKTPSSGETEKNLHGNIGRLRQQDQVKFVIGSEEDYQWSKAMLERHDLPNRCQILFSPVSGRQDPAALADKILRDRLPVRFQIQLHKLLWQDARGR